MDLASLNVSENAEKGAWLHLRHPTTDKLLYADDNEKQLPTRINLRGADSENYRRLAKEKANKMLQKSIGRRKDIDIDIDSIEDNNLETAIACTVSWENVILNKQELSADAQSLPKNARKLYGYRWILEQVLAFIEDRAHFLTDSSAN